MERSTAEQRILDDIANQIRYDDDNETFSAIVDRYQAAAGEAIVRRITGGPVDPQAQAHHIALRWATYAIEIAVIRRLARTGKGFALLFTLAALRTHLNYRLLQTGLERIRVENWVTSNIDDE